MHEEWNSRRCLSVGNSGFSIGLGSPDEASCLSTNADELLHGWLQPLEEGGTRTNLTRRYRNLVPPRALYATIIARSSASFDRYFRPQGGAMSPMIYIRPDNRLPRQASYPLFLTRTFLESPLFASHSSPCQKEREIGFYISRAFFFASLPLYLFLEEGRHTVELYKKPSRHRSKEGREDSGEETDG